VNNAAVSFNEIDTNSVEHAETVLRTNFYGARMLTQALLPLFRQSPATSRILNISSQLGLLNVSPHILVQIYCCLISTKKHKDALYDIISTDTEDPKACMPPLCFIVPNKTLIDNKGNSFGDSDPREHSYSVVTTN
jgi:hypothetical protein